jgi:uncharacterized protein (UPF0276 family)
MREPVKDVEWFEVISENFFTPAPRPWSVLERVREQVPIVLHGVGMGLGDRRPVDPTYLDRLQCLIEKVEPQWVSDHLCWTSQGGHHSHDLLPLVRDRSTVKRVADNILAVQDRLGQRLAIENVSTYVEFADNEMSEVEFLSEVVAEADCWILLDVNNVCVNATNHGFDAHEFIGQVPLGRVRHIHVAGHTVEEQPEGPPLLIDTHVGPVPEPVWALYRAAVRRFGNVSTLVEWDEAIESYAAVVQECKAARAIAQQVLATAPIAGAAEGQ